MTAHSAPSDNEPTLFDYLDAAVQTVQKVAPNLFDRAHPAGDLIVQDGSGHFAMAALDDQTGRHSVWAFIDLGAVLGVSVCTVHGNTIDPARARALAAALTAWADRKDPRP